MKIVVSTDTKVYGYLLTLGIQFILLLISIPSTQTFC
jgi:hypothetical protein